ncbi:major facilitator superfamily transporter [Colletotrichum sojae]|uniref:Major facilitator superfamily transporter n=1 Tax=Colletotrichum sojae TaxID=2175907 RepID=A0A8H6N0T4_9PEZI|nr:major facilitator superfamily transporter [Colletotrichum sojae]
MSAASVTSHQDGPNPDPKSAPDINPKPDADISQSRSQPAPGREAIQLGYEDPEPSPPTTSETTPRVYITGWRLYAIISGPFRLSLSLFLSMMETTIVSTSLVSITNALHGFEQRDWVVTSYLLTYTGFLIIFAKFSDILGRKFMILLALALFIIFSIVCGVASSMVQLIVFRALQGVGASGIFSMVTVINPELVPSEKWGNVLAFTSLVIIVSSVLGPILGGVINDHGSWRWVFLLNAPAGAVATAILVFILPTSFPNLSRERGVRQPSMRDRLTKTFVARLDLLGAAILLSSSVLLVFGFEEAGSRYPWNSPAVISTIAIGGCLFLVFCACEYVVGQPRYPQEPVFPLRLMRDRQFVGLILVAFFTGPPFMTALINLPQRFQAVNGLSPFRAGVHLLPFLLSSPLATAISGQLATKWDVPPFYLLLFGASMQMLGIGLASSPAAETTRHLLGFEVIMGFGFGMTLATLLVYVPLLVDRADLAVSMGAVTQVRTLGGTIGLAVGATILNNQLATTLPRYLTPAEMQAVSNSVQNIETLRPETRNAVRSAFGEGYAHQLRSMLYFSSVVLLAITLLWERKLKRSRDMAGY